MTEAPGGLPSTWARLHPLSPVAKGGRAVLALLFVTAPRQLLHGHLDPAQLGLDAVGAGVIVAAGLVSWLVTRWRVCGAELQLETGLLRRQSIRVPLARVQAVDVVRPLAARLLGISELRLVLAGGGTGRARLAFLPQGRAVQVRAQLLAVAVGHQVPVGAVEEPLARVPAGRLVAATLLLGPAVAAAVVGVAAVVLAVTAPGAVGPVAGASGPVLLGVGTALLRRLNVEWGFAVNVAADGLHLRSGLLQTRAETIPYGRVQGVRLVEPLLWRPFGWCRLEVDVAQQREREVGEADVGQLTRALLPVGPRADVDGLLARVLPGAGSRAPVGAAAPRRSRLRAPLAYPHLATWHDARHVVARTGWLQVQTVFVPLDKVQSVRWSQGPVQRRLQLASVHVDTAGRRWRASARDRDGREALALLATLPRLAGAARDSR